MRKVILLLLLLPLPALAEVYVNQEPPADWAQRDVLRITILQTGRTDAILVECGGEAMLIDGGSEAWGPYLREALKVRGLSSIRYFLNTHPHHDHAEGLIYLMQQGVLPEKLMSPFAADWHDDSYHDQLLTLAWNNGVPFRLVKNGDVYDLGGAQVHIYRTTQNSGLNSCSAIQLITFGDSRILLCADITGNAQKALMAELPEGALTAEIIKVPHHGVKAMVDSFLTGVSPALLMCTNNPGDAPDLARQAENRNLPLLYSGAGEIVLETDGTDWYVRQAGE